MFAVLPDRVSIQWRGQLSHCQSNGIRSSEAGAARSKRRPNRGVAGTVKFWSTASLGRLKSPKASKIIGVIGTVRRHNRSCRRLWFGYGLVLTCTFLPVLTLSSVWQLRGWAHNRPETQAQNALQYTTNPAGGASVVILSRSDGRAALKWDEVKDVRDGRERLGYNPAVEARDITHEDLDAVRAREEYTTEDGVKRLQLPAKGGDRAALARL